MQPKGCCRPEKIVQAKVTEDEDGKEWVVDENTVQKETKCPVGMELN